MRRKTWLILLLSLLTTATLPADKPKTLAEATKLASAQRKPILLEFSHADCEYCEKAAQEAEDDSEIRRLLESVVVLPLDVETAEGGELKDRYQVGTTYPVFVLTRNDGDVVKRWTGYSTAAHFAATLAAALKDLSSINDKIDRFEANPTRADAEAIANYFSETGKHLEAIKYYRKASALSSGRSLDYSYKIFTNTANGVWKDMLPYEDVFPAADAVLAAGRRNVNDLAGVGRVMARLARKFERTDRLAKYLQAGIDATSGKIVANLKEANTNLRADYAMLVDGDTSGAIAIKRAGTGDDWRIDRDKSFAYAKWCLERKIDLSVAELLTRKVVDQVFPGKYRAMVYNVLAEICFAEGKLQEAFDAAVGAVEQHPDNEFYSTQLERFREALQDQ